MPDKKIDTIIFDLDGTLINSLEDLKVSVNYALFGFKYPKQTLDMVRNNVGNGVEKLMERSLPDGRNNTNFEVCLSIFKEHYAKNMDVNTKPYPHILELLATLKSRGYKLAVVSNKFDAAVKPLCKKYFKTLIDVAIGQEKETKKKPAPDTVYIALDELHSKSENAIFVGDSEVDIQTAKNAGMNCISVSWGYKTKEFLKQNGASIIIDTPLELLNHV